MGGTEITFWIVLSVTAGICEETVFRSYLQRQFMSPPNISDGQYLPRPMVIGYDNISERYVAHWIDVFGGRFSETLGYGKRAGNEIDFIFEYPDGPFRTNFIWDATRGQWHW